jgi:hypothetical protein
MTDIEALRLVLNAAVERWAQDTRNIELRTAIEHVNKLAWDKQNEDVRSTPNAAS